MVSSFSSSNIQDFELSDLDLQKYQHFWDILTERCQQKIPAIKFLNFIKEYGVHDSYLLSQNRANDFIYLTLNYHDGVELKNTFTEMFGDTEII